MYESLENFNEEGESMTLNENSNKWMARYPTMTREEMWLMVSIWKKYEPDQSAEGLHKVVRAYLAGRDRKRWET